jgi:hypothetical protein
MSKKFKLTVKRLKEVTQWHRFEVVANNEEEATEEECDCNQEIESCPSCKVDEPRLATKLATKCKQEEKKSIWKPKESFWDVDSCFVNKDMPHGNIYVKYEDGNIENVFISGNEVYHKDGIISKGDLYLEDYMYYKKIKKSEVTHYCLESDFLNNQQKLEERIERLEGKIND